MSYGAWSNTDDAGITLNGSWVQDPASPSTTAIQFLYGGVGRQEGRDRARTALQFVGRAYPVYDVGEAKALTIQVTTRISTQDGELINSGLVDQVRGLGDNSNVMLYRDNRGRKVYGIISDFSMTDLEMGDYAVSFLVNAVDYSEGLLAPS